MSLSQQEVNVTFSTRRKSTAVTTVFETIFHAPSSVMFIPGYGNCNSLGRDVLCMEMIGVIADSSSIICGTFMAKALSLSKGSILWLHCLKSQQQ